MIALPGRDATMSKRWSSQPCRDSQERQTTVESTWIYSVFNAEFEKTGFNKLGSSEDDEIARDFEICQKFAFSTPSLPMKIFRLNIDVRRKRWRYSESAWFTLLEKPLPNEFLGMLTFCVSRTLRSVVSNKRKVTFVICG